MRMPQVLPEGPGFGSRLGINGYAVARSEDFFGFRQVMTEDTTGLVAGEHLRAGVFDTRPLTARAENGEARADGSHRPAGAFCKQECCGVFTGGAAGAL